MITRNPDYKGEPLLSKRTKGVLLTLLALVVIILGVLIVLYPEDMKMVGLMALYYSPLYGSVMLIAGIILIVYKISGGRKKL